MTKQYDWTKRHCENRASDVLPMTGEALQQAIASVPGWEAVEQHHLRKTYLFKNFVDALAFVNWVGEVAEQENHHPDISLTWGKVRIETFTHTIHGINDNDFILAAKIDRL